MFKLIIELQRSTGLNSFIRNDETLDHKVLYFSSLTDLKES